jgi:hypothetical protein
LFPSTYDLRPTENTCFLRDTCGKLTHTVVVTSYIYRARVELDAEVARYRKSICCGSLGLSGTAASIFKIVKGFGLVASHSVSIVLEKKHHRS